MRSLALGKLARLSQTLTSAPTHVFKHWFLAASKEETEPTKNKTTTEKHGLQNFGGFQVKPEPPSSGPNLPTPSPPGGTSCAVGRRRHGAEKGLIPMFMRPRRARPGRTQFKVTCTYAHTYIYIYIYLITQFVLYIHYQLIHIHTFVYIYIQSIYAHTYNHLGVVFSGRRRLSLPVIDCLAWWFGGFGAGGGGGGGGSHLRSRGTRGSNPQPIQTIGSAVGKKRHPSKVGTSLLSERPLSTSMAVRERVSGGNTNCPIDDAS